MQFVWKRKKHISEVQLPSNADKESQPPNSFNHIQRFNHRFDSIAGRDLTTTESRVNIWRL